METSVDECLEAIRDAAERLGESPTKAQYEELGLTPAASTIARVVGGWNEAKEQAGLETNPSRGSRTAPKPDDVSLPDDLNWAELSPDQRWHYRNAEWNAKRTLQRRARLRSWANDRKAERGCADCGESDPACLDFHHRDADEKAMAITDLITYGHSRERLRTEMANCDVLCANCHHRRHRRPPPDVGDSGGSLSKRERLLRWSFVYRREQGCRRCPVDDPACLQFHHPDPAEKEAGVGNMIAVSAAQGAIRSEARRCVVLCANCHRREHFEPPAVGEAADEPIDESNDDSVG